MVNKFVNKKKVTIFNTNNSQNEKFLKFFIKYLSIFGVQEEEMNGNLYLLQGNQLYFCWGQLR